MRTSPLLSIIRELCHDGLQVALSLGVEEIRPNPAQVACLNIQRDGVQGRSQFTREIGLLGLKIALIREAGRTSLASASRLRQRPPPRELRRNTLK